MDQSMRHHLLDMNSVELIHSGFQHSVICMGSLQENNEESTMTMPWTLC